LVNKITACNCAETSGKQQCIVDLIKTLNIKIVVFGAVIPCRFAGEYRRFEEPCVMPQFFMERG
jgi:hypothetical protein